MISYLYITIPGKANLLFSLLQWRAMGWGNQPFSYESGSNSWSRRNAPQYRKDIRWVSNYESRAGVSVGAKADSDF